MPITYKKTVAMMHGECAVEEAEALWSWLRSNPGGKVNLKQCEHIHSAVLQVLMKAKPEVSVSAQKEPLNLWLKGLW